MGCNTSKDSFQPAVDEAKEDSVKNGGEGIVPSNFLIASRFTYTSGIAGEITCGHGEKRDLVPSDVFSFYRASRGVCRRPARGHFFILYISSRARDR